MTNKTIKLGVLFLILAMLLIAGLCLAAFERNIHASILMFSACVMCVIIFVYQKDKEV